MKIFCQHFWASYYFTFEYQFYTKLQTEGSIVSKAGNEANYIIEETDKVQIKLTEPVYRHSCYVLHKVICKGTVVLWYVWAAKLKDRDVTFNEKN